MKSQVKEIAFCTAEDRADCDIGVKLLVLSFENQCDRGELHLFHKNPSPGLQDWLIHHPRTILRPWTAAAKGWDTKPDALLTLLNEGYDRAVWLDTDIMLSRNPVPFLMSLGPDVFLAAEEPASVPDQGTLSRVEAWGEQPGITSSITVNSCVLQARSSHRELLHLWRDLMNDRRYTQWFERPQPERPFYAKSDQDVLNVAVGSKLLTGFQLRLLKSGPEVLHSGGPLYFGVPERIRCALRGKPYFVHAIAMKPWVLLARAGDFHGYYWTYRKLSQEVSPYVALAKNYRLKLEDDTSWLEYRTALGALMRLAGMGNYVLRGLPLSATAGLIRALHLETH